MRTSGKSVASGDVGLQAVRWTGSTESRNGRPGEIGARPWLQYIALALITSLAIALRMYKLGEWSFWIDEIFTVNRVQAHYSSLTLALQNVLPHTKWVPVSLLLTAATTSIFGISEWSVRLVPAIVGGLSIPVLYFAVKTLLGTSVALISALLLAVSPWHVMWSQNARFYTVLLLFYSLALVAVYAGLERNRPTLLAVGLVVFYLAMSERNIAALLLPVVFAYLVLLFVFRFPAPEGANRRSVAILSVPVIGGLAVTVPGLVTGGFSSTPWELEYFIGNAIDSPPRILILIIFSLGLPIVVLGTFAGGWLVWQRSRAGLFLVLSATVPIILLIGISPWVFVVERYALVSLPAWLILSAVAVERLLTYLPRQGLWLAGAVLFVLLANAAGDHLSYYALNNGNKLDWRGAYAYVASNKAPGDLVYSDRPEIAEYYLKSGATVGNLREVKASALTTLDHPAWFVVDSQAIWAVPAENREWLQSRAQLEFVWYLRVREQTDLKLYYYEPAS